MVEHSLEGGMALDVWKWQKPSRSKKCFLCYVPSQVDVWGWGFHTLCWTWQKAWASGCYPSQVLTKNMLMLHKLCLDGMNLTSSHQYLRLGDRVCENALGRSCWHRNYTRSCWSLKCAIFLAAINQTFLARTPSLSLWCRRLGLVNSWRVSVHVAVFGFPWFLKQVLEDAKPFPRVPLQMAGKHDCPVMIGDFRFFRSVGRQLWSPQEAIIPFWGASNPTIAKDCSDKNAYKDQIRGGAVEVFLWRTEGGHGKTKIGCSHSKCWQVLEDDTGLYL